MLVAGDLEAAEAADRQGSVNEILILQALAHDASGDRAEALTTLERALLATEPDGHIRLFLDEGAPVEALLEAADVHRVAPTRAQTLSPKAQAGATAADVPRQAGPRDPSSDRELEVLRLLNTAMSGPEIARELFVSPNTLRTHTKHIFTKLEVNNRQAAVHRAAEMGLI
jgi:LuxR family maltose regulon positive regulatory protein